MMKAGEALERGISGKTMVIAVTGEEAFLREQVVELVTRELPEDVEVSVMNADEGVELRDLFDDLRMRGLFGGDRAN